MKMISPARATKFRSAEALPPRLRSVLCETAAPCRMDGSTADFSGRRQSPPAILEPIKPMRREVGRGAASGPNRSCTHRHSGIWRKKLALFEPRHRSICVHGQELALPRRQRPDDKEMIVTRGKRTLNRMPTLRHAPYEEPDSTRGSCSDQSHLEITEKQPISTLKPH